MDISVPKTGSEASWFFLQSKGVLSSSSEFAIFDAPAKAIKTGVDLFSLAAKPKMTTSAPLEETDPDESDLEEYEWFDQEEAKIEDIQTQWEDGSAYESPEAAEAWMLEIASLQADIDSSPYLDDETKAAFDAQFNIIYSQPCLSSKGGQFYTIDGRPMTLGDAAFGYTANGEYYGSSSGNVYTSLQQYQTNPAYQDEKNAITDSLNTIQEMLLEEDPGPPITVSAFDSINSMYADLLDQMNELAEDPENMTPAQMLLLQFTMMQLSQLVEAMSNTLAGFGSISATVVRNFK